MLKNEQIPVLGTFSKSTAEMTLFSNNIGSQQILDTIKSRITLWERSGRRSSDY